ncbi:MAG: ABC transporter ATP-binding protein [Deltaproteobacteria bacterium]|nr:MAG: ABC transporter ATP-binding protein [Deltaproteobacteria bacterium]
MHILVVEDLVKYFGGLRAVDHLSLTVSPGEVVGLIGPNGAGKTTVFNLIAGVHKPDKGKITFKGQDVAGLRPYQTCRMGIGRTFQTTKPFNNLCVLDNVIVACYPKSKTRKQAQQRAEELIQFVGLGDKGEVLAKHLTLVERKLLEIARAMAHGPSLLLLDEVMAGLNEVEINNAIDLINRIRDNQIGIIIIEHIFKVIMSITDKVVVLDHGKKIAEGPADKVVKDEHVLKAYFGEDYAFA